MKVPRILRHFQLKIFTLQLRFLIAKDLMSKDGVTTHLMPQDGMAPIFGHKVLLCHNILCHRVKTLVGNVSKFLELSYL